MRWKERVCPLQQDSLSLQALRKRRVRPSIEQVLREPGVQLRTVHQVREARKSLRVVPHLNDPLTTVCADVLDAPGVLKHATNGPLDLLSFAVANPLGAGFVLKLARSAMKELN